MHILFEFPPAYESANNTGIEHVPGYTCSVQISAHLLMKREFDTLSQRSCRSNRQWQMVTAELRGTVLILCTDNGQTNSIIGLQIGDVGIAADYARRSFVLRLRCEERQFLLATGSRESMFEWYDAINEAIAISLPLESPKEPRFRTCPRGRQYNALPSMRAKFCVL